MIPGKIRIVTWCATIALGSLCLGSVYDDLAPVRERMQAWVESQEIAGAVTAVADAQRVLRLDAVGYRDVASQIRLQENDLFWIASMTKPMVAVCILMLQEQGLLSVDDSVEKYLPEFKQQWILQEQDNERRVLVPATTPITLRHLLTHSSGLADVPTPRSNSTLAELVMAYAREPLRFPPGDRWSYSNSGINTLGRIIEVVSGQSFVGFLEQRLLRPLRMVDTTFWPTPAQATRLAKSYRRSESGQLEEVPVYFIQGGLSDKNRTPFPSGGLFSSATDIVHFHQMMLGEGTWRGTQLLSPNSVKQLTAIQSGDLRTGFTDGMSWGLGFQVVRTPQGVTRMLSPGTFGHGGAYGTQAWADPSHGRILILMIQRSGIPNGDASPFRDTFQSIAMEALTKDQP